MKIVRLTLLFLGMCTLIAWGTVARAIATEVDSPFDPAGYFYNPIGWTPVAEGFQTGGKDAGDCVLRSAPICRRVAVEADVTAERAENDQWKVVGVAIFHDRHNYWHFGMVQPPDGSGRANFCELSQMRNSTWNSQHNLKLEFHELHGEPWKIAQPYRLRIELDPAGIEGSLRDDQGKLLERKRYAFSKPAVTTGRPGLRSPGFAARLRHICATYSDPVTEPGGASPTFPPYASDSFVPQIQGERTGYFHVEKIREKWWAIDPLGRGYVPMGVDHVSYHGHWCESLGYAPYHRKMQEMYHSEEDWIEETATRLKTWGFNRIGAEPWTPMIHHGLCHSRFVGIGTPMAALGDEYDITPNEGRPCSSFPNVFHPAFEMYCRYQADRVCRDSVGDPWLLGYFLDNELAWWGRGDLETGLFDAVMKKSPEHTAKLALRDFLAQRYQNDVARLNASWGTDLTALDDILTREALSGGDIETVREDKKAFLALIAKRYFEITTKAIREIDPDHMILGCRFAGGHASDVVWAEAVKHSDVITLNYYGNVDLDRGIAMDHQHNCQGDPIEVPFARFTELAQGRPLMVTEWSFIALDSGLPCTNGAGQRFRTQTERATAARIYAEALLRMPHLIGFDYFMWADEPELGISSAFPENSNYGLVNGENAPYPEMVEALSSVTHRAGELRLEGRKPHPGGIATRPVGFPTAQDFVRRWMQTPRGDHTAAAPSFKREGNMLRIDNGRLSLQTEIGSGPVLQQMRLGDLVLGSYNTCLHQWAGRSEWPRVNRVVHVNAQTQAHVLLVDLTSRFETAAPGGGPLPFEVTHRIWMAPGAEWFIIELLSCRNTSTRPMELRGIYFQPTSTIGGKTDGDKPASVHSVPRLWGRPAGDAWIDDTVGAFLGMVAPEGAPLQVSFWLNEWGGQHPDARWEVQHTLTPGEILRPKTPIYWIVLAGEGNQADWDTRQRTLAEIGRNDHR